MISAGAVASDLASKSKLLEKLAARGHSPMTPEETYNFLKRWQDSLSGSDRCEIHCPECGGSGFVKVQPDAKPGERGFGQVKPCSRRQRKEREAALKRGEYDRRCGLEADEIFNLDWKKVIPGISDGAKARDAVQAGYERGNGMILLYGTFGQAKTLSMKIAVAQAIRDGKSAAYAKLSRVLNDIRRAFDERENKTQALLEKIDWWNSLDLLCLDELDKAHETDWAEGIIFDLFDDRWVRAVRGETLTVASANFANADEVPGYLRSRLEDNRFATFGGVVYLNGPDGRKAMPEGYRY